jgi:hypothetical protein
MRTAKLQCYLRLTQAANSSEGNGFLAWIIV